MARVYADVNAQMPRAYWDYDSVNISWGILENYEVVRKIGMFWIPSFPDCANAEAGRQVEGNTQKFSKASMSQITRNASSRC